MWRYYFVEPICVEIKGSNYEWRNLKKKETWSVYVGVKTS